MINIRNAKLEDAQRLVEIYSYYVLNTAVSFEYEVPTVAEFQERMKKVMEKYPYLVAEEDGQIVGYAYSSPYSCREAYAWSVANSIYLDKDYRRQGIGSLLYQELEKHLKENGIINLLAGVAFSKEEDEYLTHGSYNFHTRMGYEKVAHMKDIGKKFDRWYDLLWLQKKI
ncbi:MAG: N-acetyltransferase [Clostridiales bacterium]|nr:N-acetyltransferase [Clostridiales bacterium]